MEEKSDVASVDGRAIQKTREELVSTAVKFLQNPRVIPRPKSEKEAFLLKKGLSPAEIAAAFESAGAVAVGPDVNEKALGHYSSSLQVHKYSHSLNQIQSSRWVMIRDIANTILLFAGTAISLHYLYKKIIAPWLFTNRPKPKTMEEIVTEKIGDLTKLVGDVSTAVANLSQTVMTLNDKQNQKMDLSELKAEVASLKALLLGRRQFPAPPSARSPSIPSWQLSAVEKEKVDSRVECSSESCEGSSGTVMNLPGTAHGSLSSSPEIISVEDIAANRTMPICDSASIRDPSESSESGSAEMVDMTTGGSGEDTD